MQAPTVANEFLELLQKSELLSADQVRRISEQVDQQADVTPEVLARTLVQKRVLTPFQAERLLEGRYRGFVIDGYRVREVLGVGGMGCVYIAEDPEQDRKVALKVMSSQHALDAGMLARLKLEAAAGMKVQHPNVIETYRIDSTGAVHYMVMELMRGISLHELVALHGPVKWQMACDIFRQVAKGLHAAHKLGIIHRDIKPANVLIDSNGIAKLLDFGLAKLDGKAGEEFSLAMIFGHDCLGTPDYIAPEQAEDSNSVTPAADIYSLGCTLYVALTGRVPYPEKTNQLKIQAHKTRTPKPIGELRKDVPSEVIAIVEKMMARDPEQRYQSAAEVVQVLKPFARRRPVKFEFRQLVTLRAKQAREKEKKLNKPRKTVSPRSSITSASGWINNPSHHFQAELDTFAGDDTPAVRQPAPPRSVPSAAAATSGRRPSTQRKTNVPKGWSVRRLKSRQQFRVTRVKTRVGSASECEVRISGDAVDQRQCYIEYDGNKWTLHQESRTKPTYVNGKAAVHAELRHGAQITFSDGSGFEFLSEEAAARDRRIRRQLLMLLGLGALAGLITVAIMSFL